MEKKIINAIVVEDEDKSRENLLMMLAKHCPQVTVIAIAENMSQAVDVISTHKDKIDLAFLDIQLGDGVVFTLLNILGKVDFDIIFVSAFKELAIQGYKYSAIDFIPKPIDAEVLRLAVERSGLRKENSTRERVEVLQTTIASPNNFDRITISAMDSFFFVDLKDIIRLEGHDNYSVFFLENGEKLTSSKTIKVYEEMLATKNFFRVHKSHIINVLHMKKFMKGDGGYVMMTDGKEIEVSRRRRPILIDFLKKLNSDL